MTVTQNETIFGGSFLLAPIGSQPPVHPRGTERRHQGHRRGGPRLRAGGGHIPKDAEIEKLQPELSRELLQKAGELGLLSIEIPEDYDGMDLDKKTTLVVLEELGKQASFSVSYGAHTGIGTLPIVYFGTPEQKAKYLPKLASGEWLAAYALTEPGAGSDAMNSKTTAVLDGDTWVLNGLQDVDHQRRLRGRLRGVRQGGGAEVQRLHRREDRCRLQHRRRGAQAGHQGQLHPRPGAGQRAHPQGPPLWARSAGATASPSASSPSAASSSARAARARRRWCWTTP